MDTTYKMCKLALPLFFLVVRMNVGYSVVAEFIIQHEDMTSITEALMILCKRWDECDIEVGNFMIDCQQLEENTIHAVFPDSVVYLCAFHRLQAWLRWLVNTKNRVSNYQTYCMALLRAMGDAKTEDGYTKVLMALQKLHVWLWFPNFRNYYTNQWALKKKVEKYHGALLYKYFSWVGGGTIYFCLFADVGRSVPCREAIVQQHKQWIEAQNKTFKYSFLNCCQNMSMSRLIYLLIHIFVPTQMVK